MLKQRDFWLKGAAGYLVVLLISFISQTESYYIAGLVPLFPLFGIIAQILVHKEQGIDSLRETVLFGMFSTFPYLIYLLAVFLLIDYLPFYVTLASGVALWAVVAWVQIKSWARLCRLVGFERPTLVPKEA
jgi:uncharacterized membrane protein (GlpM family)